MDIETERIQQGQPSLEAYQIAMQYSMGALIAEHRQRETEKRYIAWPLLILLYLFMIGLLIFLISTVINNLDSYLQFLSLSFINIFIYLCLILFLMFVYGFMFLGIPLILYRNRNPSILHCTNGLIYRRGGRTIAMHWNEIESVRESIWELPDRDRNQFYTCTLRLRGKKYAFAKDIENARGLGRMIEREITRSRITSYRQRIKQGERLRFGPLSISQEGMSKGPKLVSWNQISQIHIFQGVVAIVKDGVPQKWSIVRVAHIPNFFLFVALLYQLTDGRVCYQPLVFEFKDYFLELIRLPFRKKVPS